MCDPCRRFVDWSLLLGYRYMQLNEAVNIREDLVATTDFNVPLGTQIVVQDSFATTNQFQGVDLGFAATTRVNRWNYEVMGRLAMGNVQSIVTINGSTAFTPPPGNVAPGPFVGGLLAQTTNIGRYTINQFGVIPELGLTAGYQLTPAWRWNFGYNFIYFGKVLRAGDQIDLNVNRTLIPNANVAFNGAQRPIFTPHYGHLWIHTLSTGLEYRF